VILINLFGVIGLIFLILTLGQISYRFASSWLPKQDFYVTKYIISAGCGL
jgi:hypothetical protein